MLDFQIKRWDEMENSIIKMWKSKSEDLTVFSYYERKKSFIQAYKNYEYFVVYIKNNGSLIWILPIQKSKNKIEFLWTPRCDYHELIRFTDEIIDIHAVLKYLKQTFPQCIISLSEYIYNENINNLWSPILLLSLDKASQYIRDKLNKYYESKIRKMNRAKYYVDFKSINLKQEKKKFLPILFKLHKKKWNSQGIKSQFDNIENKELYYYLIDNLPNENTQINLLFLNWNVIAIHFWFIDKTRFYCYKDTYDIGFKKYSPWIVLTNCMVNHAIKNKCKLFDHLRGDELYKKSISNRERNNSFLSC